MKVRTALRIFFILPILIFLPVILVIFFYYVTRAAPVKADIFVDVKHTIGPFPERWKAFAQGGEEKGVPMLENVTPQIALLYPRYIRLDHIFDFYDVVSRNSTGTLSFDWSKLDQTVCHIYKTGAKPFFSIGYMPEALSGDSSLISAPKNWNEWSYIVQNLVERYSGTSTRLCGQVTGYWMTNIYYEVWNEPDLETFGKWSIHGGNKDYRELYKYSVKGAQNAQNVFAYQIGGPATTKAYKNWMQNFLQYVKDNNLRIDFISWHHYSQNTEDYINDVENINTWLADPSYASYKALPKIVSEWGFDSDYNPEADSDKGAAHTLSAIRNFIEKDVALAFLFEIKDGVSPSWGILTHEGNEKPRYKALKMLNILQGNRIDIEGEGSFVTGLASLNESNVQLVLTNYDPRGKNAELVPITFSNLTGPSYTLKTEYLSGQTLTSVHILPTNGQIKQNVILGPNAIASLQLIQE